MEKTRISVQDQVTKLLEAYQDGRISEEVYEKNLARLMDAVIKDTSDSAVIRPPKGHEPDPAPREPPQAERFEQVREPPRRQARQPAQEQAPRHEPQQSRPPAPQPPRQTGPVLGTPSTALPVCRKCGSPNLHICTDGSGTCNNCGKAFLNLSGRPERIKKERPQPKPLPQYLQPQQYAQPYPPPQYYYQPPPQQYQQPPPYQPPQTHPQQQYRQPPPQQYQQPPPYQPPQAYQQPQQYRQPVPEPRQQSVSQYQPPKQYAPYNIPVSNANGVSPKCKRCGSNNLHICSDGSGSCNYCGKAFLDISGPAEP